MAYAPVEEPEALSLCLCSGHTGEGGFVIGRADRLLLLSGLALDASCLLELSRKARHPATRDLEAHEGLQAILLGRKATLHMRS